ncbi:imidazolonepropionase [Curtobacterium sp. Curtsp57]|uniref:imidazolonepropionase n=1 Tax=Curtobacterium sp. Curtsp57 TaxID=3243047 RepID=UPI0039B3986B
MTSELITDIGELRTMDPADADGSDAAAASVVRHDQAVVVEGGRVAWVGPAADAPAADHRTSVGGRACLPGWVDSHTHLVFAGDRATEFVDRMAGRPYEAGGIMTTVAATRDATDEELSRSAAALVDEAVAQGTTTIEAKTGYGLDVDTELRLARIAAQVADVVTFLGAHVVPTGVDRRTYLDLVTGPMLDAVRPHVGFIDVFCESGAFSPDESRAVLLAGRAAGLGLRVHGNQLGETGGVALAVELGAASVDHCNHLSAADVDALAGSDTIATLLPACDLSTRAPFAPARTLVDAGARIALASNCNPGTSFTSSMQFQVATAVLQQRLTLEEALGAATLGGAAALGLDTGTDAVGSIHVGGPADLQVIDAPTAAHIPYRIGTPLTAAVWQRGRRTTGVTAVGGPR